MRPSRGVLRLGLLSLALGLPAVFGGPLDVRAHAQPVTVTHWAGANGGAGWFDGSGTSARLSNPGGLVVDPTGAIYFTDTSNHTVRKVGGDGTVRTIAGYPQSYGYRDGRANEARFAYPAGIARDTAGNIYVSDLYGYTIRRISPDGVVSTLAGSAWQTGSQDGTGSAARFGQVAGMTTDASGNLFVADYTNATIRKVTPAGQVTTFAGMAGQKGAVDGNGSAARFCDLAAITMDGGGNLYASEECTGGNSLTANIRKVTPAGDVTTLLRFRERNAFSGLTCDEAGNLFATRGSAHLVVKISPSLNESVVAGQTTGSFSGGFKDGKAQEALFSYPRGIALGPSGDLFVGETGNSTLRRIATDGSVTTIAGQGAEPGKADGPRLQARFSNPGSISVDSDSNLYVSDSSNHTIRRISASGMVTTYAGTPGESGPWDGPARQASFSSPAGTAVGSDGTVYVADRQNATIRRISPSGTVSTVAGLAQQKGSVDGAGSSARFNQPYGIAVDKAGNLYVADTGNHTIRKVTSGDVVTTFAGVAGQAATTDGTVPAARFNSPRCLTVDAAGILYVGEPYTIRRVTPEGVVTTIAGRAGQYGSVDGAGSEARFRSISGIAIAPQGEIYVTDEHTVRKVTPDGVVSTGAGKALEAGSTDGSGSLARFAYTSGIGVDASGTVYVSESPNHCIRKVELGLPDAATIDRPSGSIGQPRQLDTSPRTATAWTWDQVLGPEGSAARLSSTGSRDPVFTPDVPGNYAFRLTCSDDSRTSTTVVSLTATTSPELSVSPKTLALRMPQGGLVPGTASLEIRFAGSGTLPWTLSSDVPWLTFSSRSGSGAATVKVTAVGTGLAPGLYTGSITVTASGAERSPQRIPVSLSIVKQASLSRARVAVDVVWRSQYNGVTGVATPISQADSFAYFYFSDPNNPEVFVKVLDFGADKPYLVFYAGLTDYEYTVTFTNTETGKELSFTKPAGSFSGGANNQDLPHIAAGAAAWSRDGASSWKRDEAPTFSASSDDRTVIPSAAHELLLSNGGVAVSVSWKSQYSGQTGQGTPLPQKDSFGYFYFSDRSNPEVFVKVLDFGPASPYLLFFAGLTDYEYTVTYRNTRTGQAVAFTKEPGSFNGGADNTSLPH
ncbi:MAG: hypothetical protein L6R30_10085 [Thermoanaerobaculia bacterium]|nr:hypothetical protein [Thermoanaerobaculia bacterium]